MSKAKLEAAAELIREKRYDEARILLKMVDHPKAKEWLKKLDRISPELPEVKVYRGVEQPHKSNKVLMERLVVWSQLMRLIRGVAAVFFGIFLFVLAIADATNPGYILLGITAICVAVLQIRSVFQEEQIKEELFSISVRDGLIRNFLGGASFVAGFAVIALRSISVVSIVYVMALPIMALLMIERCGFLFFIHKLQHRTS